MQANTQSISIDAPADRVAAFVAEPPNLPRWAVGFATSVRRDGERWLVATRAGEVPLRITADARLGVVDFHLMPSPGHEVLAASRAVPRGEGTEYVFTQFQGQGMPDDVFAQNVRTIAHELVVLKALLEVQCPL